LPLVDGTNPSNRAKPGGNLSPATKEDGGVNRVILYFAARPLGYSRRISVDSELRPSPRGAQRVHRVLSGSADPPPGHYRL
jgi:hypothetical protein